MRALILLFLSGIVLYSSLGLTQTKRILPFAAPDVTCVSKDKLWELLINTELGIIRVVDVNQKMLSHKVTGLRNDSKLNSVSLYNFKGQNGLPEGIVFEANLNLSVDNAFGVNDTTGKKTTYSCRRK